MGTEGCYQSPAAGGLGRLKGPGRKQLRREEGRHKVRATRRQHLVLFLTSFLSAPLASQRLFHSLLLARFQVKGVSLNLLDDVLLLNLAFKAAQRVLEGLTLLNSDFRQTLYTPKLVLIGPW